MSEQIGITVSKNSVNKRLAEEPIVLPGSPFWEIFKDLSRDESIALGLSTVGVAGFSTISSNPGLLAAAGILLEKAGFFVHSSRKAINLYKTTEPEERGSKRSYVDMAIRDGLPNLYRDLLGHDLLYAALLLLELQKFPETPAWMLSIVAFIISVGAVSAIEVIGKELLYKLKMQVLKRMGFSDERHYEARFVIDDSDSEQILQELAAHFELGEIQTARYHDTYFETNLKQLNSRKPVIRVRKRDVIGDEHGRDEIQVIYTRASQLKNQNPEQYNYYPVAKDKFQLKLTEETQRHLDKMTTDSGAHEVFFTRDYAHIPEKMLISTDRVSDGENSYTVIEVKSFRNDKNAVNTMIRAMHHIMAHYSVVQTTHSKQTLTRIA